MTAPRILMCNTKSYASIIADSAAQPDLIARKIGMADAVLGAALSQVEKLGELLRLWDCRNSRGTAFERHCPFGVTPTT